MAETITIIVHTHCSRCGSDNDETYESSTLYGLDDREQWRTVSDCDECIDSPACHPEWDGDFS